MKMKLNQLLLIGAATVAVMGAAQAQTVDRAITNEANAIAEEARANAQAARDQDIRDTARLNMEVAERKAEAEAKARAAMAEENQARAQREQARAERAQEAYKAQAQAHAHVDQLDDDATIKMFLESYGYKNVGPIQIDKTRAYLQAHGLHHVSEIGVR